MGIFRANIYLHDSELRHGQHILEKTGNFFQVCWSSSVLIFGSGNHPWLFSRFYYSIAVFLC